MLQSALISGAVTPGQVVIINITALMMIIGCVGTHQEATEGEEHALSHFIHLIAEKYHGYYRKLIDGSDIGRVSDDDNVGLWSKSRPQYHRGPIPSMCLLITNGMWSRNW